MGHTPGIGRLIGSQWPRFSDLVRGEDTALAGMMARWFFDAGPAQLAPLAPPTSLIALVCSGWTGTVSITVGASSRVISTPSTTSIVELLDRIIRVGSRRGGEWAWSIDGDGFITISSTAAFELTLTGTTLTRLGLLSGPYSGAYYYVADAAAYEVHLPSLGLLLTGADAVARGGGVTQAETAATASTGMRFEEESGTIRFYGTQTELVALIDTLEGGVWDVGCGGDWSARVRVRGIAREPWGKDPTRSTLAASVVGVSS